MHRYVVASSEALPRLPAILWHAVRSPQCGYLVQSMVQALVRRLLIVLCSMYFDDASMQDWAESAVQCQACVAKFMQLVGSPWAPAKSQSCASSGDFLGLLHDLSDVATGHIIRFWPRPALTSKVGDMIQLAREIGLPSGTASKL